MHLLDRKPREGAALTGWMQDAAAALPSQRPARGQLNPSHAAGPGPAVGPAGRALMGFTGSCDVRAAGLLFPEHLARRLVFPGAEPRLVKGPKDKYS